MTGRYYSRRVDIQKSLYHDALRIESFLRPGFSIRLSMEDNMKTSTFAIFVTLTTPDGKTMKFIDTLDEFPSDLTVAQLLMVAGK